MVKYSMLDRIIGKYLLEGMFYNYQDRNERKIMPLV